MQSVHHIGEVPDSRWAYIVTFEDGDGSVSVCVTDLLERAWEAKVPTKAILRTLEDEQGMLMEATDLRELTLRGLAKGVVTVDEETSAPRAIVVRECGVLGARMKLSLPPASHELAPLGPAEASRMVEKIARDAIRRCARERAKSLERRLSEALETVGELKERVRALENPPPWKRQTLSGIEYSLPETKGRRPSGPGGTNARGDQRRREEKSARLKRDRGGGLKLAALSKSRHHPIHDAAGNFIMPTTAP